MVALNRIGREDGAGKSKTSKSFLEDWHLADEGDDLSGYL
jgi:hypothetical protein